MNIKAYQYFTAFAWICISIQASMLLVKSTPCMMIQVADDGTRIARDIKQFAYTIVAIKGYNLPILSEDWAFAYMNTFDEVKRCIKMYPFALTVDQREIQLITQDSCISRDLSVRAICKQDIGLLIRYKFPYVLATCQETINQFFFYNIYKAAHFASETRLILDQLLNPAWPNYFGLQPVGNDQLNLQDVITSYKINFDRPENFNEYKDGLPTIQGFTAHTSSHKASSSSAREKQKIY